MIIHVVIIAIAGNIAFTCNINKKTYLSGALFNFHCGAGFNCQICMPVIIGLIFFKTKNKYYKYHESVLYNVSAPTLSLPFKPRNDVCKLGFFIGIP